MDIHPDEVRRALFRSTTCESEVKPTAVVVQASECEPSSLFTDIIAAREYTIAVQTVSVACTGKR